jgi:hypothetical protein
VGRKNLAVFAESRMYRVTETRVGYGRYPEFYKKVKKKRDDDKNATAQELSQASFVVPDIRMTVTSEN